MSIKTKVEFSEAQKAVTAQIYVESDTLSPDEVIALSKQVAEKAQEISAEMTMRKAQLN
jgi:hypothetical protein